MSKAYFHHSCFLTVRPESKAAGYPAVWPGRCKLPNCPQGGRFVKGDTISGIKDWDGQASGQAVEAHDPTPEQEEAACEAAHEAEPPPTSKAGTPDLGALGPILMGVLGPIVASQVDARVRDLDPSKIASKVAELLAKKAVATIEIKRPDLPPVNVGIQHPKFPELLAMVSAGVNVWVVGPAGGGKTHAAEAVAHALSKPFYYTGTLSESFGLSGFKDATGTYQRTAFRECWEFGGVFCFDEVDASDPSVTLWLNAALANGVCPFPDRMVKRHEDCVIIATANTHGQGATQEYVGRSRQDAAFLDRFAYLEWPTCEGFESAIVQNDAWVTRVQRVRANVAKQGVRMMVTMRASIMGARMLAHGVDQSVVESAVLRKGMSEEQWKAVS